MAGMEVSASIRTARGLSYPLPPRRMRREARPRSQCKQQSSSWDTLLFAVWSQRWNGRKRDDPVYPAVYPDRTRTKVEVRKWWGEMVQLGGLEPPTSGSTDRRSN